MNTNILTFKNSTGIKYQAKYLGNKTWDLFKLFDNHTTQFLAEINYDKHATSGNLLNALKVIEETQAKIMKQAITAVGTNKFIHITLTKQQILEEIGDYDTGNIESIDIPTSEIY